MFILDINSKDSKCKIKIIENSDIEISIFNKMIEHYSFKKQIDIDSPQLFCDHTQISWGYSICQKYDTCIFDFLKFKTFSR